MESRAAPVLGRIELGDRRFNHWIDMLTWPGPTFTIYAVMVISRQVL